MSVSVMQLLLQDARAAAHAGEVPVAAAVVDSVTGEIVARAVNQVEASKNATAHAELLAIQAASHVRNQKYLQDCDLYVTLEPCAMCAGAIAHAKLRRVYFAAYDPKGGAVEHGPCFFAQPTCHHAPEIIGGLCEQEAAQLLKDFFANKR